MAADINADEENGAVYLDFQYESYKLSKEEAERIGMELIREAGEL